MPAFEACQLFEKTADGNTRRIAISPVASDRKALEMAAREGRVVTHVGRSGWDDEFVAGRMLKRGSDDRYFQIVSVTPVGMIRRGASHAPKARLNLSVDPTDHGV